jgi:hypothetical protein
MGSVTGGDEEDPERTKRILRLALRLAAFSILIYFVYYLAGYLVR